MKEKLCKKDYAFIGSMLFGMLFGAGNLIFPVHLGQEAGSAVWWATAGFLISAIGLPFLAIIAMGISESKSVYHLASRVGHHFAMTFTLLLYLAIGPFFAIPRLATTSYQIGIAPFVPEAQSSLFLAIYSLFFFIVAWFLAKNPTKLLSYIGKILNPIFLIVLGALLIQVVLNPIGSVSDAPVQAAYQSNPVFTGILEGYNTLDALAMAAFGIIVISTIRGLGVTQPTQVAKDTIKSGAISVLLMGVLYCLLAYAGTTSLGKFAISENGGIALAQIAQHYLGTAGSLLLALIIFFGCLKTAVGLLTAVSEAFAEMFPSVAYKTFLAAATIFPAIFANVGLTNIIVYSIPVLMFLYPLTIVLVLLALADKLFKSKRSVYRWTIYFTIVAALIDALKSSPDFLKLSGFGQAAIHLGEKYLPFFDIGMGWVLPACIGLIIGVLLSQREV
ncbi:branched-chain amino acid transport system II carrier protein [Aerococcaceae bacterium NML130460]|nr:branched-chain amino acid transport system II carrier protein [Aerococcaceae bacterium NML130460]